MGNLKEVLKIVAGQERRYVSPDLVREAWRWGHTVLESEFSTVIEGSLHLRVKPGLHCFPLTSSHQPEAIIPWPHGDRGLTGEWPANLAEVGDVRTERLPITTLITM